ncbi:hypothetical protein ACQP3D_28750, partial [Escherichia coli]
SAWGHSAYNICVNLQTLVGTVEDGNGQDWGLLLFSFWFCSMIWPFEGEPSKAQDGLGVTM